jgi:NAD(P)H-quinone oxidoreductase subunit 4L
VRRALRAHHNIVVVMAVEMAVGFGVDTARFRAKGSVEMEEAAELKE